MTKTRSYDELLLFDTFDERLAYLKLDAAIGEETFGFDRFLNQVFYNSAEWKDVRRSVIIRDNCCDLGCDGYDIFKKPIIHHMNPITKEQILNKDPIIFNQDYLITVSPATHKYIHYGNPANQPIKFASRLPNDTTLW